MTTPTLANPIGSLEKSETHAASRWLVWSLALAMMLLTAARITVSLYRNSRLTDESGVFTAMAMDFAHGVLYRPLLGPDGIGGTRYFPL